MRGAHTPLTAASTSVHLYYGFTSLNKIYPTAGIISGRWSVFLGQVLFYSGLAFDKINNFNGKTQLYTKL